MASKNRISDQVLKGPERAPHRSLLYALGLSAEEMKRPLIGVVSAFNEIIPGHIHLDKIAEAGLTLVASEKISVPAVKELPLTLECKIVYQQKQELPAIIEEYRTKFYPQDVDGAAVGANRDAHIAYYGEIVNAYILE